MDIALMNWGAVALGTVAAFGLGMVWFGPLMFGKAWAYGSHNIRAPSKPPVAAMVLQFAGTLVLALVVGITETDNAIFAAIGAILAVALIVAGMDLFSKKSARATVIDTGYIVTAGVLMIAAQAML